MADVNRGNRPLSPFMIGPYYRPQWTSMSSIFVRITALVCLGLAVFVVWWLLAASSSSGGAFGFIDGLMRSWLGDLVLFFGTGALLYHMLGRLRHVIWDFGYFLDVATSEKMAKGMVGISVAGALLVALIF